MRLIAFILAGLFAPLAAADKPNTEEQPVNTCPAHLDITLPKLHSNKKLNLCDLTKSKKSFLVVNTASYCGYTPQFKSLEQAYKKYKDQGFTILGFPSNDFNQEDKSEEKTADVCYKNYGVTFPMFQSTNIKGEKALPLFQFLASKSKAPQWNFNKYLVKGEMVTHYSSNVAPLDSELEKDIQAALKPAPLRPTK